jgi:hypothetical protein
MKMKPAFNQWTRRNFIKGAAGLSLATMVPAVRASGLEDILPEYSQDPGQDFKYSWRIKPVHWTSDEQFYRWRDFFREHRDIIHEISIFVGRLHSWHGYVPPEIDKDQFDIAGKRMEELRSDGFSLVGYNVWPTFGDEDDRSDSELPLPPMIGHNGHVAKHVICPSSPGVLEYISRRFSMLAEYHPDFIWVDDDARLFTKGTELGYPCFCNICLSEFQEGRWESRKKIVEGLNHPDNVKLREEWIEYNAFRLDRVCKHIKDAVRKVDQELDLAFMTVGPTHTSYSGDFIRRCMETLESVRGRPGHGFYVDAAPRDILRKAMDVAWQIADYPDFTIDIQYEYEDFPSIPLDKARTIVSAENALAVASGCNGIAVHTFQLVPNSFEEYGPMMESLQADYNYLQQMTRATASTPQPAGLWIPWTSNFMARRMVDGKWFSESSRPLTAPISWCEFGIPVSAERDGSSGTILAGDAVNAFTDRELKDLFSGAVFMDGQALEALGGRGLAHLTGVRPGEKYQLASERLTDHKVNGRHAGEWRNVYFGAIGLTLETTGQDVQVFSDLYDVDSNNKGACLTGYTNELGGRVVVMGYHPWERFGTLAKLFQIREVVDWATGKDIPVRMDPQARIAAILRTNADRSRVTAVLLNNSFDEVREIPVVLRAPLKQLVRLDPSGKTSPIDFERQGGECHFHAGSIPPWQTVTIIGS